MNKQFVVAPHARGRLAGAVARVVAESLEGRTLFAAVSWTGAAGDDLWTTAANWSGGAVPSASDDVTIDVAANPTIKLQGASQAVRSLNTAENLQISDVTLAVTNGGVNLVGGADVALNSTGSFTTLDFRDGNQTLGGSGEVIFAGGSSVLRPVRFSSNNAASLTIGSGVTVRANGGSGVVGNNDAPTSTNNQGVIISQTANQALEIAGKFTNSGTVRVADGSLRLTGAHNATGRTEVAGGELRLGGSFTQAGLGTFVRTGGTVNVVGALSSGLTLNAATGSWNLAGGRLVGGTYSASGGATLQTTANSTLDGVTIASDFSLSNAAIGVVNNLTLADNAKITLSSTGTFTALDFQDGDQTLGGSGAVEFAGVGTVAPLLRAVRSRSNDPTSLTIGPGVTVRTNGGSGVIGNNDAPTSTINQGTIVSQTANQTLEVIGKFTTSGAVRVTDGVLRLSGAYAGDGGALAAQGGTLDLRGSFTQAGLGAFSRAAAATVNITGLLSGGLSLTPTTGSWNLAGGTLAGGTLQTSGGAALIPTVNSGFDGVTIASDFTLSNAAIGVVNNLTLANGAKITFSSNGTFTALDFHDGDQTLGGNGIVEFAGVGTAAPLLRAVRFRSNDPASLTIGSGVTVRTNGGSGVIGNFDAPTSTINQGTIIAQTANQTLEIAGKFTNAGTVRVTDGVLRLSGAHSGAGRTEVAGGELQLGGSFAQSGLGTFVRTGGVVNVVGTLSGGLTLNASTGSWNLAGGKLVGGVYSAADGAALQTTANSTLDGVTIASDFTLSNAAIGVVNNLTLANNAKISISSTGGFTALDFHDGDQTLGGAGVVEFTGVGPNAPLLRPVRFTSNNPTSLTIGPGVTVRTNGGNGVIGNADAPTSVVNQGTIFSQAAGQSLEIAGKFTNAGTVRVRDGVVVFSGAVSGAAGTINVDHGRLDLGGSFTQADLGNFVRSDGVVNIFGTLTGGLTLNAATGSWNLVGGRLVGGTYSASDGATLTPVFNSVLDGVTIASDLTVADVVIGVVNNLTLADNAKIFLTSTGAFTTLDFRDGNQTLGGQGSVEFVGTTTAAAFLRSVRFRSNDPTSLTIGPGVTVRANGANGVIGSTDAPTSIINQGAIVSQAAGRTLEIVGQFTSSGTVRVNDGVLLLSGAHNSTGQTQVAGGELQLGGTFTQAGLGTFTRSGGAVNVLGTLSGGLTLSASTGSWNLTNGGGLVGGTYSASGGATLRGTTFGFLNGVTLASDFTASDAIINVTGGLTLSNNAVVHLASTGAFTSLDFRDGDQTLGGQGEVRFEGVSFGAGAIRIFQFQSNNPASLTVTQGVKIRVLTGSGTIATGSANASFINQGTISLEAEDSTLVFQGVINNAGTIAATNAGTIFSSGAFNNSGFLTLAAGATFFSSGSFNTSGVVTFQIGGSAQGGQFGRITSNNGNNALNGVANVEIVGGFQPTAGDKYDLLQFTGASGAFGVVNGLVVNGVMLFTQSLSPTAYSVTSTGQGGGGPLAHVTDVFVSSGQWATNFLQTLVSQGLGELAAGVHLGAGRDATLNLPWTNLNQVSVRFDRAVNVKQSDLVIRGVRTSSYAISSFIYDATTNTATWTLANPFGADKIQLDLNADAGGVTASNGGRALDGDYAGALPSGDGTDGGDFRFNLNVLPGDITRNGQVNAADLGQTRRRTSGHPLPLPYLPLADVNGDGVINAQDQVLVTARLLDRLPAARIVPFRPIRTNSLVGGISGMNELILRNFVDADRQIVNR